MYKLYLKVYHILGHKIYLNKFKGIDIICCQLSDAIKLNWKSIKINGKFEILGEAISKISI
jgi:hypothetical protein